MPHRIARLTPERRNVCTMVTKLTVKLHLITAHLFPLHILATSSCGMAICCHEVRESRHGLRY